MPGERIQFHSEFELRPVDASDGEFLREMLFETLLSEPNATEMKREMLSEPDLAWYVEDWGRKGDFGFVALDPNGERLGAAWARLATGDEKGYGFFDKRTPEIAIATVPASRGMGVGSSLLKAVIDHARKRYPALSLSVVNKNPAKRLYERHGFETVVKEEAHSLMVLRFG